MFSSGSSAIFSLATGFVLFFHVRVFKVFVLRVNLVDFCCFGILQMIDLYWTVIPVMLAHYYSTHPLAQYNWWRSRIAILLTWVWSLRLTHNYFRREKWQWGAREDWRFTDMRCQYGKHWWWVSFFAVYVSQQVYLYVYIRIYIYMYNMFHSSN